MKRYLLITVLVLLFIIKISHSYENSYYYVEISCKPDEIKDLVEVIKHQEWFAEDKLKLNSYGIYLGPYDLSEAKQIQDNLCYNLDIPAYIVINIENGTSLNQEDFFTIESTFTKYVSKDTLKYYDDENVKKIINYALELYTLPYKWGGTDIEKGIDCSYFVKYIYSRIGINLPRTSREQFKIGKEVSKDELKCGDLVFFKKITYRKIKGKVKRYEYINHVGIYLKDNEFIHAARGSKRVTISSLSEPYYKNHFAGARRIVDFIDLHHRD